MKSNTFEVCDQKITVIIFDVVTNTGGSKWSTSDGQVPYSIAELVWMFTGKCQLLNILSTKQDSKNFCWYERAIKMKRADSVLSHFSVQLLHITFLFSSCHIVLAYIFPETDIVIYLMNNSKHGFAFTRNVNVKRLERKT